MAVIYRVYQIWNDVDIMRHPTVTTRPPTTSPYFLLNWSDNPIAQRKQFSIQVHHCSAWCSIADMHSRIDIQEGCQRVESLRVTDPRVLTTPTNHC